MSTKAQNLLDVLLDTLHKRIASGEASPADLNVARQLLKDNNVGFIKENPKVTALVADLPFDPNADVEDARLN